MIAMALACEPELLIADEPTPRSTSRSRPDFGPDAQLARRDGDGHRAHHPRPGRRREMCDRVARHVRRRDRRTHGLSRRCSAAAAPLTQGLIGSIPVVGASRRSSRSSGHVPNLIDSRGLPLRATLRDQDREDVAIANEVPLAATRRSGPRRPVLALPRCRGGLMPRGEHGERIGRRRPRPQRARLMTAAPALPPMARAPSRRRGTPLVEVTDLVKHFPVRGGILQRQIGLVQAVDGVSFTIRAARPSASSGSRAAARPRSGACCCGSSSRRRARSCSTARTSPPSAAPRSSRIGAACRSSSRTPTRASTPAPDR